MTQGPQHLHQETEKAIPLYPPTQMPSWRISQMWWWKWEAGPFFPENSFTRNWTRPKETVWTKRSDRPVILTGDSPIVIFFLHYWQGKGPVKKTILFIHYLKKWHLCTFKLYRALNVLLYSAPSLRANAPISVGINSVWINHFFIWHLRSHLTWAGTWFSLVLHTIFA